MDSTASILGMDSTASRAVAVRASAAVVAVAPAVAPAIAAAAADIGAAVAVLFTAFTAFTAFGPSTRRCARGVAPRSSVTAKSTSSSRYCCCRMLLLLPNGGARRHTSNRSAGVSAGVSTGAAVRSGGTPLAGSGAVMGAVERRQGRGTRRHGAACGGATCTITSGDPNARGAVLGSAWGAVSGSVNPSRVPVG